MKALKFLAVLALTGGVLFVAARLVAAPAVLKTSEFGKGPTIVLVHGLGGTRMQWMPTARKLLAGYRVVLVDLPGHGESPMPDPFSIDNVAESLDGVLAKQNRDSTVLVGHGLGGLVALAELRRHPDRVKGLVVIDAAAKFTVPVAEQEQKYFLDFVENNYDVFLRQMFIRQGRDSAQGVAIHAQASLVPKQAMTSYIRALLNVDESNVLKAPKIPVLYVGSSRAWSDTTRWSDIARQRGFPDPAVIKARRIGKSGYLIMSDQPDSLAAVLADFTKRAVAGK